MDIMNLIHDICLTKNKINNTPKWRFIEGYKQSKRLNEDIINFLDLDIFNASENIISFLVCFNEETLDKNVNGFLQSSATFIKIQIQDDQNTTHIMYLPKRNRFEINNKDVAYTIYRNTKISNQISKMWEPLTHKIKERYVEIILNLAEYI